MSGFLRCGIKHPYMLLSERFPNVQTGTPISGSEIEVEINEKNLSALGSWD